jgi:hypothetical protein
MTRTAVVSDIAALGRPAAAGDCACAAEAAKSTAANGSQSTDVFAMSHQNGLVRALRIRSP